MQSARPGCPCPGRDNSVRSGAGTLIASIGGRSPSRTVRRPISSSSTSSLAELGAADGEAADAEPADREAADRGGADGERADRERRRSPSPVPSPPGAEDRKPGRFAIAGNRSAASLRVPVTDRPTLLAIQHVPWEGPHRILDACGALPRCTTVEAARRRSRCPRTRRSPAPSSMGGPMNVDDVERFPALAAEREWLAEAVRRRDAGARHLPRGAAAGAGAGRRGAAGGGPEIGFAPVEVSDPDDPLLGGLAPSTDGPALARRRLRPARRRPARSPPRRRPSTRPSATATPGACSSIPRPTSPWSRPGWRCRR